MRRLHASGSARCHRRFSRGGRITPGDRRRARSADRAAVAWDRVGHERHLVSSVVPVRTPEGPRHVPIQRSPSHLSCSTVTGLVSVLPFVDSVTMYVPGSTDGGIPPRPPPPKPPGGGPGGGVGARFHSTRLMPAFFVPSNVRITLPEASAIEIFTSPVAADLR